MIFVLAYFNITYNTLVKNILCSRYECGSARKFLIDEKHETQISMTCQWNKEWTRSTILEPCDWVQCLKPPEPPLSTNLRSAFRCITNNDEIYVFYQGIRLGFTTNRIWWSDKICLPKRILLWKWSITIRCEIHLPGWREQILVLKRKGVQVGELQNCATSISNL